MTVTNRNRYIGQISPFEKAVHAKVKKWRKVKTMEDMEYSNARLIPKYK